MRDLLKDLLKKHEGLRLNMYKDTVGKCTIGYGHNLDDKDISLRAADVILEDDISDALAECRAVFSWFVALSDNRQAVVASMVFNMGLARFKGFKRAIAHIEAGYYDDAAREMLDSKWASQVGRRAEELAQIMREG